MPRLTNHLLALIPDNLRATAKLRALGLFKIPMLFFISPQVVEISPQRCVIKIPFVRRNKNHLGSMYFGVLSAGADCAGGLIAWRLIEDAGNRANLIFKDFHAEFLKRAEGDVYLTCNEGDEIRNAVEKALESGERENVPVHIRATVPSQSDDPVAEFKLTLSMKRKKA